MASSITSVITECLLFSTFAVISGCTSNAVSSPSSQIFDDVKLSIESAPDSKEQALALWKLLRSGHEVIAPNFWWMSGFNFEKDVVDELAGLKTPRLFHIVGAYYVFYGELEGKSYLYLLSESSYPDGKLRFVALVACDVTNVYDPGTSFDTPSIWDQPVPGPGEKD